MSDSNPAMQDAAEKITAVIHAYNDAVRTNDPEGFRKTFHPTACVTHYQTRKGEINVITLDEFIAQIASLYEKFGSAVEVSEDVQVDVAEGIASARVPFRFHMGDNEFTGVNIFGLAIDGGEWRIMSKVYSL